VQRTRIAGLVKAIDNAAAILYNIASSVARDQEMNNHKLVIYHNPRCSKSRETLQLLEDRELNPEIINYLDEPPSAQELKKIIALLGVTARDLMRTTESVYRDADLDDDSLSDEEIIEAICEYPALLQRPIVVFGDRAVIGRPPARVLDIVA
jgi:arsenate reductase